MLSQRKTLAAATILLAIGLYEPIPTDVEDYFRVWQATKFVSAGRLWFRLTGRKVWQFDPIETIAIYAPPDDAVRIHDKVMKGVPVRFYDARLDPKPPSTYSYKIPDPIVLWIHGGGFAFGSVKASDRLVQRMAKRSRLLWASVEYRKSPTHVFPAAHEDVLLVARKLLNRHPFQKLVVIGASVGGNLAASLSQLLRPENPEKKHPIISQVLTYPALQAYDWDTPSHHLPYAPVLSHDDCKFFVSLYFTGDDTFAQTRLCTLDDPLHRSRLYNFTDPRLVPAHLPPRDFDRGRTTKILTRREEMKKLDERVVEENPRLKEITQICEDPRVSPLVADDVSRLPPTYIQACEYDVLRDDAIFYAARLRDSGVDVKLDIVEKTYHGVFTTLNSVKGKDMVEKALGFIVEKVRTFRDNLGDDLTSDHPHYRRNEVDEDEDEYRDGDKTIFGDFCC